MIQPIFKVEIDQNFTGRESELEWLDNHLLRQNYSFTPIFINGFGGVGKTSLIKHWLSYRHSSHSFIWLDLSSEDKGNPLEELLKQISHENEQFQYNRKLIVVIDNTDSWDEDQHREASIKIFNFKVVSSVVFIRRQSFFYMNWQDSLTLSPLTNGETADLIRKLSLKNLDEYQILEAMEASKGFPLAIKLLSQFIQERKVNSIISQLDKPLYELSENIIVPKNEIIPSVSPIILSANKNLIASLKRQPSDIRSLTPRDFEKLLAELMRNMGWDVELTKQTKDGGSDILAYLNTEIGRLLCLVEAKHYREDRKIGVDLVRTLYGTLCDAQANSAMLVTSSSFTKDAREFQQKHQYQLTLRDYADVVSWIRNYGGRKSDFA